MYDVAVSESPVRRGDSLVGTYGFGLAWLQVRELDVGAVDVKARRQTRFEEQNWAVCLGQYDAAELNPDVRESLAGDLLRRRSRRTDAVDHPVGPRLAPDPCAGRC